MSGRESVESKAHRLLTAGRLIVTEVGDSRVRATCDGDHGRHDLGFETEMWSCSCPARVPCSHLLALQLVTRQPDPVRGDDE